MQNRCINCLFFVEEIKPGDYSHLVAVKNKRGFCLIQDLFTMVKPDDKACNEFNFDGEIAND